MSKTINMLCINYTKIFIENAKTRSTVCDLSVFGYYLDIKRDFGYQRLTTKLHNSILSTFKRLGFKDIQFNKFGGISLSIYSENAISFAC